VEVIGNYANMNPDLMKSSLMNNIHFKKVHSLLSSIDQDLEGVDLVKLDSNSYSIKDGKMFVKSDIKNKKIYEALLKKSGSFKLEKVAMDEGVKINHTYYKDGFSILRSIRAYEPSDIFIKLDEFILNKIIFEKIVNFSNRLGVCEEKNASIFVPDEVKKLYSGFSKRKKARIVAKHYFKKWNRAYSYKKQRILYLDNKLAYVIPRHLTFPTYRIIWGEPNKYNLFQSPGAPPEKLEKEIINNFNKVFVVSKDEKEVRLYNSGKYIETQKIACGKNVFDKEIFKDLTTPEGVFMLTGRERTNKKLWDKGYGTHRICIAIKTFWGYDNPVIFFHGTKNPASIGKNASEGCIRTHNPIIKKYYDNHLCGSIIIVKRSKDHKNKFLKFDPVSFKDVFLKVGYSKRVLNWGLRKKKEKMLTDNKFDYLLKKAEFKFPFVSYLKNGFKSFKNYF